MNERFGTAMIKKWYGPSESRGFSGGSDDEAFKIRGEEEETEEEKKKRLEKERAEKQKQLDKDVEIKDSEIQKEENKVKSDREGYDKYELSKSKKGPLNDEEKKWRENYIAKNGKDAYDELVAKNKKSVYVKQPSEPSEPKVKTPDTLNLATLLHKYQVKNNIDPYDDQRKRYTPERFAKENPGFKAFIEAEQRKAVNTGSDTANDSQYDDVDQGQNINKGKKKGDENSESPVSMLVSRFKKQALRNV
ncbi:MAG: hypothetical protein GY760_09610 [Deltaproteobacteria bacterium]|nr:hypothetical protein [Deltaproteobacteria bacterium]